MECHQSRVSYAELDWGSVKNVEASVSHRFKFKGNWKDVLMTTIFFWSFELDEPVPGLAGKSFTLEEVPKLQIDIQSSEGKIELGKDFRFDIYFPCLTFVDIPFKMLIFFDRYMIFCCLFSLWHVCLRQELLNKFTFCSGQTAQRQRRVTERLALPTFVPPMFEMKVGTDNSRSIH